MSIFPGGERAGALFSATTRGPGARAPAIGRRRRTAVGRRADGPWGEPPKRGAGPATALGSVTSLDDFLKKSRGRFGGGGGGGGVGFGGRPDRSMFYCGR